MPAKSPAFDEAWQAHGHLDRAVELAAGWARQRPVEGLRVEVVRLPGRTPVLLMEVPGHADETVLLYGHLDKQPEMTGWSERLGPWTPVRRRDRLYGRGAGRRLCGLRRAERDRGESRQSKARFLPSLQGRRQSGWRVSRVAGV
jgi:hypothetical protein